MPDLESKQPALPLQEIAEAAHVPAVAHVYVEPKKDGNNEFASTSLTVGKKNAQSTESSTNGVNDDTRFPAASLSKIVFTYLVLQLVKDPKINFNLDQPLHEMLPYERLMVDGKYPDGATEAKAKQLTARHVLSHTTGLPNVGLNLSSPLSFHSASELGKTYSYSGEAFFYLQKVIESQTGEKLEELAQKHVFGPKALDMKRSTFSLQPKDPNIVTAHTSLEKPMPIYAGEPHAAGSLLTTADDFSKFMSAWLEKMDDPIIQQAFKPTIDDGSTTCGLGWHIHKYGNEVIAYQYGEDTNMRAFVAINVKDKKGAAFFTNSENGMSIATQVLKSPDSVPIGDMKALFEQRMSWHTLSDEPGWQETLHGMIAEDQGRFEDAGRCFKEAVKKADEAVKALEAVKEAAEQAHNDESLKQQVDSLKKQLEPLESLKQRLEKRSQWFDAIHPATPTQQEFTQPLEDFVGRLKNIHEEIDLYIRDGSLICKAFTQEEVKLVRISGTEFLPEKDQSFKISFDGNQVSILYDKGYNKSFVKQPLVLSQVQYADEANEPDHEISEAAQLEAARELTQRYRTTSINDRHEAVKPSVDKVESSEAVEEYRLPSPSQTE